MRRRPPALLILAVLSLMATGLAAPLLAGVVAATPYGSHVFQSNPAVVPGAESFSVFSGATVAQSFTVDESYYLENVTLRVVNGGNAVNMLRVSIHPNDAIGHIPIMSSELANWSQATPDNDPNPVNASWAFGPAPLLLAGNVYWIVAQNGASQPAGGYKWFSTNGDTYADGNGLQYANGTWQGLPFDLVFLDFGQEFDANLTTTMTVNHAQAMPGDSVTFRVNFNNTGAHAAPRVWINDTLPPELTNVSLGFPNVQPLSAAAFPNLTFANVSNGPHYFTVTAQVSVGTTPGTLTTNSVSLTYANVTNEAQPAGSTTASVRVGLVTKQMHLAGNSGTTQLLTTVKPTATAAQTSALMPGGAAVDFLLDPALATPLHVSDVTASLMLASQKPSAQRLNLTLELMDNGTSVASVSPSVLATSVPQRFTFSFALSSHTFSTGHIVGLRVANQGGANASTDTAVIAYNSTANDSQVDVITDTYVTVGPLSLGSQAGSTTQWSPFDSLVVAANVSDPFGASRIVGAWINITTPTGHLAAAGAMTLNQTDPAGLPAWKRFAYTLAPPLETGAYRVLVTAMEDNGVITLAQGWANVSAPMFQPETVSSADVVLTGSTFTLSVFYNNTGSGPAGRAWINDTLPAGVAFVTSDLSVTSVTGSTYTWAVTDVLPGSHRLQITTLVTTTSVGWAQNQVQLDYKDQSGHSLPTAWSNLSIFLNGPDVTVTVTSVPAGTVHANQSVTYTVVLANRGAASNALWFNLTLAPGFTYSGSTADLLGGIITVVPPVVHIAFAGLPQNATWQFDVATTSGPTLVRNTTYEAAALLTYTSTTDVFMPPSVANDALTAISPWIPTGLIRFLNGQVRPGTITPAEVSFANLGNEAASHVWVNLTVDPWLIMTNANVPYTVNGAQVTVVLTNVRVGASGFFLNLTVSTLATDRAGLTIAGVATALDGIGNPLATSLLAGGTTYVFVAQMSLYVTPANPIFEAGVPYGFSIAVFNWGEDLAANVWLNFTLPSTLDYVNDSAPTPPVVSGTAYSWQWTNMAPGSKTMVLYLAARTTVVSGTPVAMSFRLAYQGSNYESLPGVIANLTGTVVSPDIVLSVNATGDTLDSGGLDTLVYSLEIQNGGGAMAGSVFVVDTLDPRLQVVYYVSSVPAVQTNQTYNWTFPDLGPGATQFLNLTVRVAGGIPAGTLIPNVFEATYTNSAGVVLGRVRSTPTTITVETDYTFLAWMGIGVAAVGIAAVAVLRRRHVDIEEVFLVYRDGVLISHLSRTLLQEKDEDVLSGMLTAVQEFVREAFQYGEHRDLHQLDFGDYRILIERGSYVFLAVVYSGKESLALRRKVRAVIDRVEDEFGKALENWDGDMEQVIGARDLIRDTLLGSGNHNHTPKAPAANGE